MTVPFEIEESLRSNSITIRDAKAVGGGCINQCAKIVTNQGTLFLKWNTRQQYPAMLQAEAKGLRLLKSANALRIPEVITSSDTENYQYLLLEFVETSTKHKNYWESFGRGLATLHQTRSNSFGLDHDNYIGSIPQINNPAVPWIKFFVEYRIESQVRLASHILSPSTISRISKLVSRLPSLLIEEKPSLIHGDLWGGNIMTDSYGEPVLIDPAVYFGSRECDLAMTQLFGGFDSRFLEAYNAAFPLEKGWKERLSLYNVYPLLVHVNLFGKDYEAQLGSILSRYV